MNRDTKFFSELQENSKSGFRTHSQQFCITMDNINWRDMQEIAEYKSRHYWDQQTNLFAVRLVLVLWTCGAIDSSLHTYEGSSSAHGPIFLQPLVSVTQDSHQDNKSLTCPLFRLPFSWVSCWITRAGELQLSSPPCGPRFLMAAMQRSCQGLIKIKFIQPEVTTKPAGLLFNQKGSQSQLAQRNKRSNQFPLPFSTWLIKKASLSHQRLVTLNWALHTAYHNMAKDRAVYHYSM